MTTKSIIGILVTVVVSYLLGSINFAIILSKLRRQDDVRDHGSGNAGMTNMLRTYGKNLAIVTAVGDALKSITAILLARLLIFPLFGIYFIDAGYIAGVFALLGHAFPIYFGFRGGKGAMTSLGVILAIDPLVFLAILVFALPVLFISRMVSLASITGAVLFPIFTFISNKIQNKPFQYDVICAIMMSAIVLFLHRENIKRLINGNENHFEKKINGKKKEK